jgi:acetyl-CoA synthetase
VAGHRLSTFEIESALVDDPKVAEAAVVSKPHEIKGEGIVAFVTLKSGYEGDQAMLDELREHVAKVIGPIAKPDDIVFTPDLPKTRSGKIMRRLLRDVARGEVLGDVTTLANAEIVEHIHALVETGADDE